MGKEDEQGKAGSPGDRGNGLDVFGPGHRPQTDKVTWSRNSFPSDPGPSASGYPGDSGFGPAHPPPYRKESSGCRIVAIGCLVLLILGSIVAGASCYFAAKNSKDLVPAFFKMIKPSYMQLLSADHTQEEISRFSDLYDAVFDKEMRRLGIIKWAESYEPLLTDLSKMAEDRKITREESERWCREVYDSLDENGYWEQ